MKKSTGILFLIAALLAASVYFFERKHTPASDTAGDSSKPTFTVSADAVTAFRLQHKGDTIALERRSDGWYLTQPLETRGDQPVVNAIASQISTLQTERTFPAAPDKVASFGLEHPDITLEFTVKDGAKHTLRLGAKDFSGSSVYASVDNAKDVALLPQSIYDICDKPLEDFRDRTVLAVPAADAVSFTLHNKAGETLELRKDTDWKIVKPRESLADSTAVGTLLQNVGSAQISHFASDSMADLAKDGLTQPAIRFTATAPGGNSAELQLGKKEGDEYYARDTTRAMIFRVKDSLFNALNQNFGALRDKQLVHLRESDITRVQIQNENGTTTCVRNPNGELLVEQPSGAKTPAPACPNFLTAVVNAQAQEIYDQAPPGIAAKPPSLSCS